MDTGLFLDMLKTDSTTGREGEFAEWIAARLAAPGRHVETFEVSSMKDACAEGCRMPENVLVTWGSSPKVVFCSHLDTVPPYIPPRLCDGSDVVHGRGACDAKGQIFAMYEACLELERRGYADFALLLLAGEETGSFGAKEFDARVALQGITGGHPVGDDAVVIVGEPTGNRMATAAKGTKSFEVTFTGEPFHSGYPEYGRSAVLMFNDFMNALRSVVFPKDDVLGETTWNVGRLVSDNPQNILSDRLSCRVYFRTTFESDEMVCNVMRNMAGPDARLRFGRPRAQDGSDIVAKEVAPWQKCMSVKEYGGDAPTMFETLKGFPSGPVSFGSDAPQLKCFGRRILYGPGSILVAHRDEEHISICDLETAVADYVRMYEMLTDKQ